MNSLFTNIAVFLVSGGVIVVGIYQYKKSKRLLQEGISVEGIIYDLISDTTGNNTSTNYYPVVRFVTKQEEWITEKSNISGFYKKGEKVTIYYNSTNPKDFLIDSWQTKITPVAFIVVGVVIILIASLSLLLTGKLFTFHA